MPSAELVEKVLDERYKNHLYTWFNSLKIKIEGDVSSAERPVLVKIQYATNGECVGEPLSSRKRTELARAVKIYRIIRYLGCGEFIVVLSREQEIDLFENGHLSFEQAGFRLTAL